MMTLGKNITKYRRLMGLTQTQLANILGISNQRLSNWEKDLNSPNPDYLYELCKVLEVNADVLLGLKEERELTPKQVKLLKFYNALSEDSQNIVLRLVESLLDLERKH